VFAFAGCVAQERLKPVGRVVEAACVAIERSNTVGGVAHRDGKRFIVKADDLHRRKKAIRAW
jgi:hypothetical protein